MVPSGHEGFTIESKSLIVDENVKSHRGNVWPPEPTRFREAYLDYR